MNLNNECKYLSQYKNVNIFNKHKIFILSNYDDCLNTYELHVTYNIKNLKTNIPHSIKHIKYYYYIKSIIPNCVKFYENYNNHNNHNDVVALCTNKNIILYVTEIEQCKTIKITKLTNIIFVNTIMLHSILYKNNYISLLKKLFIKIEKINNLQIVDINSTQLYMKLYVFYNNINKLKFVHFRFANINILKNIYDFLFEQCYKFNKFSLGRGQICIKIININILKFNDEQYMLNLMNYYVDYIRNL